MHNIGIYLSAAQVVECVLPVFSEMNCVGFSPNIGIFISAAQLVERVLPEAFCNKLCWFESQYWHIPFCSPGS